MAKTIGKLVKKAEHKRMLVSELKENPKNPMMHPKEQIEDLAKSMKQYGQYFPIIVDETGIILCGHGKKKALELLGEKEAEVYMMYGLSDKEKMKLMLADDKVQSVSFINHTLEEDLIKEINDTDIIGYNAEYIHDIISPITYDNDGMEPGVPTAQYAADAVGMNAQPPQPEQSADGSVPAEVPTDENGQPTEADDANPMKSFTAKHFITCPHCGAKIEI